MALQLKNKVKEEKPESEKKKGGKYKRKRDVFGKRLTRFGLIGLIVGLVAAFAIVKTVCTISQNNKQKRIDAKLAEVKQLITDTRRKLARKQQNYTNVGKLISTLPTNFDKQATSIDLDRIVILSGLKESDDAIRIIDPVEKLPIECSIDTVKAEVIHMTLFGNLNDIDSVLNFVNYLTDYSHENFYYIESLTYREDRLFNLRSEIKITMYTFYNDVTLQPVVPPNDTTTQS